LPLDGGLDSGPENVTVAQNAGLRYVHDDDPGITRTGAQGAFDYRDPKGAPVRDPETLERIRKLAIPPAYQEVWICPDADGHIQATGRDARGRKQYRYHPDWRAARDEDKFHRMAAFGRALPALRARVAADLGRRALSHDKVAATVVALLELTLIRVGNDQYARDNKSFGLTTLRARHVKQTGAAIAFEFKGKSGVMHKTGVRDRRLVRIIKALQNIPGQRLFQYVDAAGARHAVGSHDINAYLHAITGEHFTAKDFRTWAGTLAAAKALAMQPRPETAHQAQQLTTLCIKAVAGLLGNTPAVCRKAYIHPAVFAAFAAKTLPKSFAKADGPALERAVLRFLDTLDKTGPL
jgi:DNA topoisomerase-1